jgi:hypothetical protein
LLSDYVCGPNTHAQAQINVYIWACRRTYREREREWKGRGNEKKVRERKYEIQQTV